MILVVKHWIFDTVLFISGPHSVVFRDHPGRTWRPFGVLDIDSKLATCWDSALATILSPEFKYKWKPSINLARE